jgi:peroxiredoxin
MTQWGPQEPDGGSHVSEIHRVLSDKPDEGGAVMVGVGEQAPDFELTNDTEATVRLSDFRGKKVILYFYPKALTKG